MAHSTHIMGTGIFRDIFGILFMEKRRADGQLMIEKLGLMGQKGKRVGKGLPPCRTLGDILSNS